MKDVKSLLLAVPETPVEEDGGMGGFDNFSDFCFWVNCGSDC